MPGESCKESAVNLQHGFGKLGSVSGHVTCGSSHTFRTKEHEKETKREVKRRRILGVSCKMQSEKCKSTMFTQSSS